MTPRPTGPVSPRRQDGARHSVEEPQAWSAGHDDRRPRGLPPYPGRSTRAAGRTTRRVRAAQVANSRVRSPCRRANDGGVRRKACLGVRMTGGAATASGRRWACGHKAATWPASRAWTGDADLPGTRVECAGTVRNGHRVRTGPGPTHSFSAAGRNPAAELFGLSDVLRRAGTPQGGVAAASNLRLDALWVGHASAGERGPAPWQAALVM